MVVGLAVAEVVVDFGAVVVVAVAVAVVDFGDLAVLLVMMPELPSVVPFVVAAGGVEYVEASSDWDAVDHPAASGCSRPVGVAASRSAVPSSKRIC